MKKAYVGILLILILLIGGGFYWGYKSKTPKEEIDAGSVERASEYHATTTAYTTNTNAFVLKSTPGTLGSVILTTSPTWGAILYNATTSIVSGVGRGEATSSLEILAQIPPSATIGVYTYDAVFTKGLLVVFLGGTPTSTLTYR